ncbi:hypothetical protein PCL_07813 [Purpureocillium lilacinum]|uniref:Uncharacterized protein n=1 Tax=Purpureocillium lilacinum TaxID=33203 RepID=A0A2U3EJ15_PURLI|nr:hypothetical protein PCL_07813 [Purpureocillium lilacinum]
MWRGILVAPRAAQLEMRARDRGCYAANVVKQRRAWRLRVVRMKGEVRPKTDLEMDEVEAGKASPSECLDETTGRSASRTAERDDVSPTDIGRVRYFVMEEAAVEVEARKKASARARLRKPPCDGTNKVMGVPGGSTRRCLQRKYLPLPFKTAQPAQRPAGGTEHDTYTTTTTTTRSPEPWQTTTLNPPRHGDFVTTSPAKTPFGPAGKGKSALLVGPPCCPRALAAYQGDECVEPSTGEDAVETLINRQRAIHTSRITKRVSEGRTSLPPSSLTLDRAPRADPGFPATSCRDATCATCLPRLRTSDGALSRPSHDVKSPITYCPLLLAPKDMLSRELLRTKLGIKGGFSAAHVSGSPMGLEERATHAFLTLVDRAVSSRAKKRRWRGTAQHLCGVDPCSRPGLVKRSRRLNRPHGFGWRWRANGTATYPAPHSPLSRLLKV